MLILAETTNMLAEARTGEKYQELLEKAVQMVESRGFNQIRTQLDGYDQPQPFSQKKEDITYVPDISASNDRGKFYFEIAQKTEDVEHLVSKWKLLATVASMKNGGLNILVPYGHNRFTQDILDNYNISANLIKLN
ncbi:MAG: hypothetical protein CMP59_04485 [Flavobacteriales bacterium]|nr:hypothetical protein [Flavobacteriales bacterium]|tara:strand:+ start:532 stop:939 length:408 start_codon:yes stop_codon:yes gene_type:complete